MSAVARRPGLFDVQREARRRSLARFMHDAFPEVDPAPYRGSWHIDVIAEHLEAVSAVEIRVLIINVPPRHMKSLAVGVLWQSWEWIDRPETKFLNASYAQSLAYRDSRKRRRLITSPWYQAQWSSSFALAGEITVSRFENTAGGYNLATSVGGTATGEGGDILVVDDPHSAAQAQSDAERGTVLEWWDQTMSTRLNDPNTGRKVIIMQRLHEDDLTGHELASLDPSIVHLCLPAEYEPAHPFVTPPARTLDSGRVLPGDPRSEPGSLLWPIHHGPRAVAQIKKSLGSYGSSGQLQQLPTPLEGGVWQRSWWKSYTRTELEHLLGRVATLAAYRADEFLASWDMTFKKADDTDFVVGTVWARRGPDVFLLDLVRARMSFTETLKAVVALRAKWPMAVTTLVEAAANGEAVMDSLRLSIPGLIGVPARESKEARAHAVSPLIEAGNVYLPDWEPWVAEFIQEGAAFPRGLHDDQVDSTSQALARWLVSGAEIVASPFA